MPPVSRLVGWNARLVTFFVTRLACAVPWAAAEHSSYKTRHELPLTTYGVLVTSKPEHGFWWVCGAFASPATCSTGALSKPLPRSSKFSELSDDNP